MKRITNKQLDKALKQLLDRGEIVIGKIRVNGGRTVAEYTALSECPHEHQEGYRRAVETCKDIYIRDVAYKAVFITTENATSIATLK